VLGGKKKATFKKVTSQGSRDVNTKKQLLRIREKGSTNQERRDPKTFTSLKRPNVFGLVVKDHMGVSGYIGTPKS